MIKNKKLNIAIVGLGNIGLNLYEHLIKNKKTIEEKTNINLEVKYVSAKNRFKKRRIKIPKKKWLKNCFKASKLKDIDIVVELIGGSEGTAKRLVFDSIKNKKHVVTANKALISKYGDQLAKLAEQKKVNLEYEAAVAGGIPVIRILKEGLIGNKINKIYGILNGTSNYILSNMEKIKMDFETVLKKAKELGYAESNPKSDLNGEDVKSKIQILSSLAFNCFINKSKINLEGINNVDQIDIKNARILGYKIKHLGVAEIENGKLIQGVYPCLVKKESHISNVNDVLNAIIIEGKPIGKLVIQGEGAGPGPTVSALVSDICSILRGNINSPFSASQANRKKITSLDLSNKIFSSYIRLDVLDEKGVLSSITKIMSKNQISVKRLIQNPFRGKKFASIIIVSHKAKNCNLVKCINQIGKKNFILGKPKFIRIEKI
jgi:homoserine dehydrogenase